MGTRLGISVIVLSGIYGLCHHLYGVMDWTRFSVMTICALLGLAIWGLSHERSSLGYVTQKARELVVVDDHALAAPRVPTFAEHPELTSGHAVPSEFLESHADSQGTMLPALPPLRPSAGPVRRMTPPHLRLVHDTGEHVDSHDFRKRHSSGHS